MTAVVLAKDISIVDAAWAEHGEQQYLFIKTKCAFTPIVSLGSIV
jgi:hypothetical protein